MKIISKNQINELETCFDDGTDKLNLLDREIIGKPSSDEEFAVIRGRKAIDYYTKKILAETQNTITTNFVPALLLRFKEEFQAQQNRGITQKFIVSEYDLDNSSEIKTILIDQEIHVIGMESLNAPILSVFKDVRPLMIIADHKKSIIVFYGESEDALLVYGGSMLKYQEKILSLFMLGAKLKK